MSLSWPEGFHAGFLSALFLLIACGTFLHKSVARRIRESVQESGRDMGMAWWLVGSLTLGTGLWAQSLLAVLSVQTPLRLSYVMPLVAAAWLPAVVVSAVSLWFLGTGRLRPVAGLLGLGVVLLSVGLVPWLMISSILLSPALGWDGVGPWPGAFLMGLGEVLALVTVRARAGRIAPTGRTVLLGMAQASGLRLLGTVLMLSAVQWPAQAQPVASGVLSPELLGPLLAGVVLLMNALLHLGVQLDRSHRQQRLALSVSLAQARDDLQEAVRRDALTQLYSRAGFEEQLHRAIEGHRPSHQAPCMAVMLLNLDGFQKIEDQWGHTLGQQLLRQVGARLRTLVRQGDLVARDERDQFLLLFVQPGDLAALTPLAQRVGELLGQPYQIEDTELPLTCSMGISLYPDDTTVRALMTHAEEAMVMARRAGGGVHCVFQAGMHREVEQQILLQRDLRHAMLHRELELHYQPKLDAASGALVGVEALLRWRHPLRGMVGPNVFIPVAERFGLIAELGEWVLQEACRQMRSWLDQDLRIPVAVNVSVHQLRQSDLEARVRKALRDHHVPPAMLLLEITETVAMENVDFSLAVFDLLASIGVQLSIDDFGTGYSSLSYLRRLPASQLKVDRSFVNDLDSGSPDAVAIVEAVVRLAHALGLQVVAEGVETPAQAQRLRQLRCDQLQGYLLGRPMSEPALRQWVNDPQRQAVWRSLADAPGPGSAVGSPKPAGSGPDSPLGASPEVGADGSPGLSTVS